MTEHKINSHRINWIDMAKGYGIILVILGHLYTGTNRYTDYKLGIWIYSFHIPLFFFLSGCVFSNKKSFFTFLLHKCRTIILPYITFSVILYSFLVFYSKADYSILKLFLLQKRAYTIWFLAALFWMNIFFYLLSKYLDSLKIGLFVVITCALGLIYYRKGGQAWFWDIDTALTNLVFFYLGYELKLHYKQLELYLHGIKSLPIFCCALLINIFTCFTDVLLSHSEYGLDIFFNKYGFPPLTYISAISGIVCVIIISHQWTNAIILYIGQNSLVYFALHQIIFIPLIQNFMELWGISDTIITSSFRLYFIWGFEFILVLLALTVCNVLITKTPLRFLIGAKKGTINTILGHALHQLGHTD